MENNLSDYERDKINEEYNFFKTMCYAIGYRADLKALCVCSVGTFPNGKDFSFELTRDEITILVNNRIKLHEQLNSI